MLIGSDALKFDRISTKKLKQLQTEFRLKKKRMEKYQKAMERHKADREKRAGRRRQERALAGALDDAMADGPRKDQRGIDVPKDYSAYEPVPAKDKDGDFDEQEGGEIEMRTFRGLKKVRDLDALSDPGPSLSERACSDEDHEGGEELYDSELTGEYGSTEAYDGGESEKNKKI